MSKTLLVSLVSDQTIPNVQIIKEFKKEITNYLFISTLGMEKKSTRKWIEKSSGILESQMDYVIVEEFSVHDIESKLNAFDFEGYDKILVNLTGGTKTMTLVASEFFKKVANEIYYVTGRANEYVKLFPQRKNNIFTFSEQITLEEYLTAYGFTISKSAPSGIPYEQTCEVFKKFKKLDTDSFLNEFKFLSNKRSGGKSIKPNEFTCVSKLVEALGYKPQKKDCLNKKEVKYLTGEWFEEYVGLTIQRELKIPEDDMLIGATLVKETPSAVRNSVYELLNDDEMISGDDFDNEMDVMFIYDGIFYSIECKSSIIAYRKIEKGGSVIDKEYNILGETLYKSDSLKNRFGLYPKTSIMTLTNFVNYCESEDRGKHHNKIREMEQLVNRANLSNIKLVDANLISKSKSLYKLIK